MFGQVPYDEDIVKGDNQWTLHVKMERVNSASHEM